MKEMPEQNLELEKFLGEIRELKRQQEEEHISQDLAETEVDDLTEEDMKMWRTIEEWRRSPLSSEEMSKRIDEYFQAFVGEDGGLREGIRSRYEFFKFLRSMAGEVIVRKQMEEMRKEKKI